MRLWVSTFVFVGVGALLLWLGAAELDNAWPRSMRSIYGHVAEVDARVVVGYAGREPRVAVRLQQLGARFEFTSTILPHPTAGALMDAGRIAIDYDGKFRVRPNPARNTGSCANELRTKPPTARPLNRPCEQYEVFYVVTGLTVDGRVYFTPTHYKLLTALWALIVLVPGGVMFGFGARWLYRLVRPRLPLAVTVQHAVASAATRDPRKTADGQWLH
jgi:hypothetical protein